MEKIIKSFFITLASLILACGAIVGCTFALKGVASAGSSTSKVSAETNPQSIVSQQLSVDQMRSAFEAFGKTFDYENPTNMNFTARGWIYENQTGSHPYSDRFSVEIKYANGLGYNKDNSNNHATELYSDFRNIDSGIIIAYEYDKQDAKWYKYALNSDEVDFHLSLANLNVQFFEILKDRLTFDAEKGGYVADISDLAGSLGGYVGDFTGTMLFKFVQGKIAYYETYYFIDGGAEGTMTMSTAFMLFDHGRTSVTLPEAEVKPMP